jgi:hypothetical protein
VARRRMTRRQGLLALCASALVLALSAAATPDRAASRALTCRSLAANPSAPYWARQRNVTVFMDSVLLSGRPKINRVMACRRLRYRGRPALMVRIAERELRASGRRVAPLVVVGLAYNSLWERNRRNYDTWAARFDADAERMVATLRRLGALQIVWVTLREPKPQFLTATGRGELSLYSWYFPYANERLHVLDRRHDDVVLADWAAVSDRTGLTYDSIHLTEKGGILMGRTIRAAIDAEARRQALARAGT